MRAVREMATTLVLVGGTALVGAGCLARAAEPVSEERTDRGSETTAQSMEAAAPDAESVSTEEQGSTAVCEEAANGDPDDGAAVADARESTGEGQQPWWGGPGFRHWGGGFGWRPWWGGYGWRPWWGGGYGWGYGVPWWGGYGWRPWGWNPWWGAW